MAVDSVMSYDDFKADGVTGIGKAEDMLYRKIPGQKGHYELLQEDQHTEEDIHDAKAYLHGNFNVVKIEFVKLLE